MVPGKEIVLKQGFMHKKRERISRTIRHPWQSGYFVLKRSSAYSGLLLDEYRDASLRIAKQTLFLDNVKHVGPVNTSKSKKYAFQVVVLGRSPLLFACDNELLRTEWTGIFSKYTDEESINSSLHSRISPEGEPSAVTGKTKLPHNHDVDNGNKVDLVPTKSPVHDSRGYDVIVQNTPLSVANNLKGNYMLQVTKSRVYLKQADQKEDVLSWPLTQLRGFKSQAEQQQIVLETGRGCHFGKGRLTLKTLHCESIIQDIREAVSWQDGKKALLEMSSGSSSESETEITHQKATRCSSEQKCNVTVSVRPRRTHSERVFNQVALGQTSTHISVAKTASISPTSFVNANNNSLKIPQNGTEEIQEDVFTFETKTSSNIDKQTMTNNWKTSHTFSKTMIDSKSDNECTSSDNGVDDNDSHPYLDIIADKDNEKPMTSDEASTLLAQVVADLTEPQKKLYFIKSNSTGGIQSTQPDLNNEIRRSSEPAVGVIDFNASPSLDSVNQDSISNGNRKFKLEKINEVSFTEQAESEKLSSLQVVQGSSVSCLDDCISIKKTDRPRSMSEMLPLPTKKDSPIINNFKKKRARTTLHTTNVGSSLTDLTKDGFAKQHKELRSTLSHSSMASVSQQLAKDPLSHGFKSGSGKIPSFPKRSVVKAVESVGGLDGSRTKFNMSPLPKEFHISGLANKFDMEDRDKQVSEVLLQSDQSCSGLVPPRPPKQNEIKSWRKITDAQESPPPLPDRSSSQTSSLQMHRENLSSKISLSSSENENRVYANTPPKVQPRTPNAQLLLTSALSSSSEIIMPPPRPPKPEAHFSNKVHGKISSPTCVKHKKNAKEKRSECYTWDSYHSASHETLKESYPQLERVKNPIVTITPPRSPVNERSLKQGQLRGMSFSESDITDVLNEQLNIKATSFQQRNNRLSHSP